MLTPIRGSVANKKVRVYELARELGLENSDIIDFAGELKSASRVIHHLSMGHRLIELDDYVIPRVCEKTPLQMMRPLKKQL